MLSKTKQSLFVLAGMAVGTLAHAQDVDLESKADSVADLLISLGLPVLIIAIVVGVLGYWFSVISMQWAGRIVIGGIVFGSAAELAAFLLA